MPSYETLDAIADAYNPLLAVISLLLIAVRALKAQWRAAGLGLLGFAIVAGVSFGLMAVDHQLAIWPVLGLDYSTHTATALGLVILLSLQVRRLRAVWFASLLCYILLMLYQRYHTVADIVTTALVVGPLLLLCLTYIFRFRQGAQAA